MKKRTPTLRANHSSRLASALALTLAAAGTLIACADASAPLAPTTHEQVSERVLSAEGMRDTFRPDASDASYWVSEVLEAPTRATRVGVFLDVAPGRETPTLYARSAAPITGTWMPIAYTWAENEMRVGHVDLGLIADAVELRIATEDMDALTHLTYSAIVPETRARTSAPALDAWSTPVAVSALDIGGVNDRASWGAAPTQCSGLNQTKTLVSVHHTVTGPGSADFAARLRGIQSYHMNSNGWCDVGYHFLVTVDGQQWEGRPAQFLGAHVGGNNSNNIGVSFIGCFQPGVDPCTSADFAPVVPPEAMIEGGGNLIGKLTSHYGITPSATSIIGHRDNPGQSTSCPGDNLHDRLGDLRTIAGSTDPVGPATGNIKGVLWDLSITTDIGQSVELGARIGGATVTLSDGQTTTSQADNGYWSFVVEPGTYTVNVESAGFAPESATVEVQANTDTWSSLGLTPTSAEPEPQPAPEPEAQPEPQPEAEPEAQPEPQPEPEPQPTPEPSQEPDVQLEPTVEPDDEVEPIRLEAQGGGDANLMGGCNATVIPSRDVPWMSVGFGLVALGGARRRRKRRG